MQNKLFIYIGAALMMLALTGFVMAGQLDPNYELGDQKHRLLCSGSVDVPAIGQSELQGVSCNYDPCGFGALAFGGVDDTLSFFSEEGRVQLLINEDIQDTATYESSFASNEGFELKSNCAVKQDFSSVKLQLFNEDGRVDEVTIK